MSSNLYKFQEKLEESIESILPDGVNVYSRRRGNIDSDIEASLANVGIAVLVFPPLPTAWTNSLLMRAEKVVSEIHIIENVVTQSSSQTAYSLFEKIANHCHQLRIAELGSPVITLGDVSDLSPPDENIIHLTLKISNSLTLSQE